MTPLSPASRALGFRRCYRKADTFHSPEFDRCDCLRTELPSWAQASGSGALGTPERNHTCPACVGYGFLLDDGYAACCPRCAGCGERKANREPADHAFPAISHAHHEIKKPRVSERTIAKTPSKPRAREALGPRFCDTWDRLYSDDRAIRNRVSAARKAGRLGVK